MLNGGKEEVKHVQHINNQIGFETTNTSNVMIASDKEIRHTSSIMHDQPTSRTHSCAK